MSKLELNQAILCLILLSLPPVSCGKVFNIVYPGFRSEIIVDKPEVTTQSKLSIRVHEALENRNVTVCKAFMYSTVVKNFYHDFGL